MGLGEGLNLKIKIKPFLKPFENCLMHKTKPYPNPNPSPYPYLFLERLMFNINQMV